MTIAKVGEYLKTQNKDYVVDLVADALSDNSVNILIEAMRSFGRDSDEYAFNARSFVSYLMGAIEITIKNDEDYRVWAGEIEYDDETQSELDKEELRTTNFGE